MFLASPAAEYMTGQTLAVDGGLTKAGLQNMARPRSVDSVGIVSDGAVAGTSVLITGGGSGIGEGAAAAFIAHGARVTVCGRRRGPGRKRRR